MYMMNNYNTGGDDQQHDQYRQYWANNNVAFSDNMMTTMSSTTTAAGGSTTTTSNGNNRSKAIRRRSRVSKKTPITLLNTDATNFRSLVQQFTGCPHPPSSSTSFQTTPLDLDANGGPINLNFQLGTVQTSNHKASSGDQTASSMVNYQHGEEMTRMGGQNHMEMVQELLMLDDAQDDFGLFR